MQNGDFEQAITKNYAISSYVCLSSLYLPMTVPQDVKSWY